MQRRTVVFSSALVFVIASAIGVAQVSPWDRPNLAIAQQFTAQASAKVSAAQQANEFDTNGHAARARQLLEQASQELKLATRAPNNK